MERPVKRIGWAALALAVTLGVAAPACGNDDSSGSGRSSTSDTSPKSYVGLSEKDAIAKAEAENRQWRILREDDESFPATLDFLETRINFEIDDGKVTKATYG